MILRLDSVEMEQLIEELSENIKFWEAIKDNWGRTSDKGWYDFFKRMTDEGAMSPREYDGIIAAVEDLKFDEEVHNGMLRSGSRQ